MAETDSVRFFMASAGCSSLWKSVNRSGQCELLPMAEATQGLSARAFLLRFILHDSEASKTEGADSAYGTSMRRIWAARPRFTFLTTYIVVFTRVFRHANRRDW